MNREYHKWFSTHLNRDMELLVFGHAGARVLVFPTREGRFYDYENWGLVAALSQRIENGWLQLFCVDSVDSESFYCRSRPPHERIGRHKQYEAYVTEEVLPLIRSREAWPYLVAHGCSIGAYHAVTIALRRPGVFQRVVALSGRYDLTRPMGSFPDLFDGHYSEDIYFHTPNHFLPGLSDEQTLARLREMDVVLAVGEHDPFAESCQDLSRTLSSKGVGNTCALWNGEAHKAKYWREMVKLYF